MDDRNKIEYIVIDWGFTWLKLWLLNEEKVIIKNSSYETTDLSETGKFYNLYDLEKIFKIIKNFFHYSSDNAEIKVFFSCQMHGISGLLKNNVPFFSTWNDLPININKNKIVNSNLGIPMICSMPNEKLILKNNRYFLQTQMSSIKYNEEDTQILKLYDPFELIFIYFINIQLKKSKYYWQSSCLNEKVLNKNNQIHNTDQDKDINSVIINKGSIISNSKNKNKKIIISPCLGDLQASTYSTLSNNDMVINFGTGSQVIFSIRYEHIPIIKEYHRIFPTYGKLPVLSHIPCGRLISDYCKIKNTDFNEIKESLSKLTLERYRQIMQINKLDLLFFPGFDANKLKYTNNPPTSIETLSRYKPDVIISNWINQYISIINYAVNESKNNNSINISVVGKLGGLVSECIDLLNQITPNHIQINHSKTSLPLSIINSFNL